MQGQQQGTTRSSLFMNRILTFELLLATRARRMVAFATVWRTQPQPVVRLRMWARCSPWFRNGIPTNADFTPRVGRGHNLPPPF